MKAENGFGARATFVDKDKAGRNKVTLYLGTEDVAKIIGLLDTTNGEDGVKLSIHIGKNDDGKPSAFGFIDSAQKSGRSNYGGRRKTSYVPKNKGQGQATSNRAASVFED